jgi:N-acetylglucosaminyl-diphospho-decaprenol L-rhamnosyltransferase
MEPDGIEGTGDLDSAATPPVQVRVVILSYRDPEAVARGLAALAGQTGVSFEVEVVDNGSPPEHIAALRAIVDAASRSIRARLIENGVNLGYPEGMNTALRRWLATPEPEAPRYILLLTQDMEFPEPHALARLAAAMDHAGHLGALGPVVRRRTPPHEILSAGGTLDPERLRLGQERALPKPLAGVRTDGEGAVSPPAVSLPVPWIDGCALFLRRRAVEEVGFFESAFFLYFEDLDYGVRLNRAGWPTAVHYGVTAHHEKPPLWGPHYPYYMARNRFLFWARRFERGWVAVLGSLVRDSLRFSAWALVQVLRGEPHVTRGQRLRSIRYELAGGVRGVLDALRGRFGPQGTKASATRS